MKNSVQKSRINLDEHFDEDSRLHDTTRLEVLSADDRRRMNNDATLDRSSITFVIVTSAAASTVDGRRAISLFADLQPRPAAVTASHVASELAAAMAVIAPFSNSLLTSILYHVPSARVVRRIFFLHVTVGEELGVVIGAVGVRVRVSMVRVSARFRVRVIDSQPMPLQPQ